MMHSPRPKTLQRIESIEGLPATEALRSLYVDQLMTVRELASRWKLNERTVMSLLSRLGLTRSRTEAVAAQWARNPGRKPNTSGLEKYRAEFGGFWQGKTKENDDRQKQRAERLKQSSSFNRPEVRQLAIRTKTERDHACRSRHINYRTPPTRIERALLDWLNGCGFAAIHNHPIGLRWVDAWLPELNLGIEVFNPGNTQAGGWVRHQEICSTGARLVYITNAYVDRGYFSRLHQAIISPEIFQLDPASHCENTVVWGCRKASAVWSDYPQEVAVERIYMDKINELRFSRSANNTVAHS